MKNLTPLFVVAALAMQLARTEAASYAISAREIHLNGYDLFVDSFDSANPIYSTAGHYDPNKGGLDQAVVASEAGFLNANNVGTVDLWGRLETAVPFSLTFGPQSSIGSISWHGSQQTGIEPGYHTTNLVWVYPDEPLPIGAALTPAGGSVNGVYYDYILDTGEYELPSLTLSGGQKVLVIGTAVLRVPGNVSLSGNAQIVILPAASLRLYVGGTANLRGGGIVNQGVAANFLLILCDPTPSAAIHLRISTPFVGLVYAPRATCTITSGGGIPADMQGSIVVRSVELGSDLGFHYDQALGQ